jgi:hypothetical protein
MDDLLNTMKQESRALQELRKDVQAVWAGAVAQELNGRYLNPHEGDDQQMLAALDGQKDALDQAAIKLDSAQTCARQAENHAATVIDSLQSVEQDLGRARNEYERYRHYESEARSSLPIIQGWIDRANRACNGGQPSAANIADNCPTLQPGPYAGESIPARGHDHAWTDFERAEVDRIGRATGCHTCGTKNPGTTKGHFIPDHQPPNALNAHNESQRLYPHCLSCSRKQGGEVTQYVGQSI